MRKIGFVICTRTDSERLPNKPFRKINGVPILVHLLNRLKLSGLPIYLAFPAEQYEHYKDILMENVFHYPSDEYTDPLARMKNCAEFFGLTDVIRVSHDKILVSHYDIWMAINIYIDEQADYFYNSDFIPGTGFEIMSTSALQRASEKYVDIEYIGYCVRAVAKKSINFEIPQPSGDYRFLIDFPEDLQFFEVVFSQLGNNADLDKIVQYLKTRNQIKRINQLPQITIYTCVKNADAFIGQAMASVERQIGFRLMEYIIIDDFSTDKTPELIANFCAVNKNAYWIRNERNLGLSSSSNIALKKAKGKYIIRLDADDFFTRDTAIYDLLGTMKETDSEIVYPDNYFGDMNIIQQGNEVHHVAGALFDKNALMHLKFTEGLKGHDSLDIFLRAKDHLAISYLKAPIFFYRQHSKSLTKNNLEERKKIKESLLLKHSGEIQGEIH